MSEGQLSGAITSFARWDRIRCQQSFPSVANAALPTRCDLWSDVITCAEDLMLQSILPAPLHPAIVHLPMALVVLIPVFAVGSLWAVKRGARPLRAWGIAVALFATLSLSSWAALETGEDTSEKVESVVPGLAIDTHEEAAEQFLVLSVIVLGIAAVGLFKGRAGSVARSAATVGALGLLVAGWNVGHSGGALVYKHGAASAYLADSAGVHAVTASSRGDLNGNDK